MQLIEKNKNDFWDALIHKENPRSPGLFLQTWKWGELAEREGHKIVRLASFKGKTSAFQALLIRRPLPFGFSYLYCPRGPLYDSTQSFDALREEFFNFKTALHEAAAVHKAIFCILEPPMHFANGEPRALLQDAPIISSSKHIQPHATRIIDLKKSSVELQSQLKPKTRYNIKVAARSGVFIKEEKNIDKFVSLLKDTAARDKFHLHERSHYELMAKLFRGRERRDVRIKTFFAYKNQVPIGTVMILFHFPFAYYLHGAFDYHYRALMAPFLLQWHVIELAKKQKFIFYDLWGIDEKRWPGVTRFKEGFGGAEARLPGTFDMVFHPSFYRLYQNAVRLKNVLS